jgi:hypothetical protein
VRRQQCDNCHGSRLLECRRGSPPRLGLLFAQQREGDTTEGVCNDALPREGLFTCHVLDYVAALKSLQPLVEVGVFNRCDACHVARPGAGHLGARRTRRVCLYLRVVSRHSVKDRTPCLSRVCTALASRAAARRASTTDPTAASDSRRTRVAATSTLWTASAPSSPRTVHSCGQLTSAPSNTRRAGCNPVVSTRVAAASAKSKLLTLTRPKERSNAAVGSCRRSVENAPVQYVRQ